MSPGDEIRWINKLAAKRGKKNLSPYHKWVLGGCKGPKPRFGARKRKSKRLAVDLRTKGPCPRTKVSGKHYREVVKLRGQIVRLQDEVRVLRAKIKRAQSELR
jgi:hypothetical protein